MELRPVSDQPYVNRYDVADDEGSVLAHVHHAKGAKELSNWFTVAPHGDPDLLVRLTSGDLEVQKETYERLMLVVAHHLDAVRTLVGEPDGNRMLSIVALGTYDESTYQDGSGVRVRKVAQPETRMYANRRELLQEQGAVAELVEAVRLAVESLHDDQEGREEGKEYEPAMAATA